MERSHIVLTEYLRQYTEMVETWDEYLDLATFSYNTSVHEGTRYTPYEIVFGKLPRMPSYAPPTEGEQLPTYKNY